MQIHRNTNINLNILNNSRRNLIIVASLVTILVVSLLATALHQNLFSSSLTAHASDTPTIVDPIYVGMLSSAVGELTVTSTDTSTSGDGLASTGMNTKLLLGIGGAMIGVGGVIGVVVRRRSRLAVLTHEC